MQISEFTFRLLLLFLPGLIATYFVDHLTVHRPRPLAILLLQAFVFGFLAYVLYYAAQQLRCLVCACQCTPGVAFFQALRDANMTVSFREITTTSGCAVILGLLMAAGDQHKVLSRIARRLKVTKKFGDLDVWGYVFNSAAPELEWVLVRDLKNGLAYEGWVQASSDDSCNAELLLRDVSVYENKEGGFLYQTGALYLSRQRDDITLEFGNVPITEGWRKET